MFALAISFNSVSVKFASGPIDRRRRGKSSGSFVSLSVPGRDNDLPRFGLSDEATEIIEESATEMGETPRIDVGLMGLLETGTLTPSPEEPALSATGIGWTGERPNSFSNSRNKDEVAYEGELERLVNSIRSEQLS